jgi:hypothetical protein
MCIDANTISLFAVIAPESKPFRLSAGFDALFEATKTSSKFG